MIENRVGNIFDQKDLSHLVHQANLYHTFGSGIAREIKERFPYAYIADLSTPYGDKNKLGTWSVSSVGTGPIILNLYCQDGIGGTQRQTNYSAMGHIFFRLERFLSEEKSRGFGPMLLGIPHGIGCGLANGDWSVVSKIIESAFEKSPVPVVICKLP